MDHQKLKDSSICVTWSFFSLRWHCGALGGSSLILFSPPSPTGSAAEYHWKSEKPSTDKINDSSARNWACSRDRVWKVNLAFEVPRHLNGEPLAFAEFALCQTKRLFSTHRAVSFFQVGSFRGGQSDTKIFGVRCNQLCSQFNKIASFRRNCSS